MEDSGEGFDNVTLFWGNWMAYKIRVEVKKLDLLAKQNHSSSEESPESTAEGGAGGGRGETLNTGGETGLQ